MKKIYCAGPLFNAKEKEEMEDIAVTLENHGYKVFLPHRDGFEFANLSQTFSELGISEKESNLLLNKAIFTLDVYQVLDSHGLILNINGRVPDEGAMVEAGIAWNAGKKVVIYKNDARTLINGSDNPLLLGLSNFNIIDDINNIPKAFDAFFSKVNIELNQIIDNSNLTDLYNRGAQIASLAKNRDNNAICVKLIELLRVDNV
jgi:nucleoside 2-deoxyribosyltransferase